MSTAWGDSDEGWKTHIYSASNFEATLSEAEQADAETCLDDAIVLENRGQPYDVIGLYEATWRLQRQYLSLSCQEQMKKFSKNKIKKIERLIKKEVKEAE